MVTGMDAMGMTDEPDERRVCVECKWCSWPPQATGTDAMIETLAMCGNPNLADQSSYVTGRVGEMACLSVRMYGGCGELGQWWEPRK